MDAKITPYNIQAEESVLSSMLYSEEACAIAISILSSKDFYRPDYGAVFDAMHSMLLSNIPLDVVTLISELQKRDAPFDFRNLVVNLAAAYYTSVNIESYAMEVRRHSETRQIHRALNKLLEKPDGVSAADLSVLANWAAEKQYIKSYENNTDITIQEFKKSMIEPVARVYTGFTDIDTRTGGIRRGSVFSVGAFPGHGKTSFALNIACSQSDPVVIFSLEMSATQVLERMASAELQIDYKKFNNKTLTDCEIAKVSEYADNIKARNIHIFDSVYYAEQQVDIASKIKPCLVIVDYVQNAYTHHEADTRLKINHIVSLYKQLGRIHNCAVLMLSQFTQPPGGNMYTVALKESRALEEASDYIFHLFRPKLLKPDSDHSLNDTVVLIKKCKFGETGKIDLCFEGMYQRFYNAEKQYAGWQQLGKEIKTGNTPF